MKTFIYEFDVLSMAFKDKWRIMNDVFNLKMAL